MLTAMRQTMPSRPNMPPGLRPKRKRDTGSDRESPSIKAEDSEEDELESAPATPRRSLRRSRPSAPPAPPAKRVRISDLDKLISFSDVDSDNEPHSQPVTPKQRKSTKAAPSPKKCSIPPSELPAHCSGDLHSEPLPIPGRASELPPIFVCKEPHPQNPRPNNRSGVDYVIVLDLSDKEAVIDLLLHGLQCPIPRDGDFATAYHPQTKGTVFLNFHLVF